MVSLKPGLPSLMRKDNKPKYQLSSWVEVVWEFINEKSSLRKAEIGITADTGDLVPAKLPMSLHYCDVVPLSEDGFERLLGFVTIG